MLNSSVCFAMLRVKSKALDFQLFFVWSKCCFLSPGTSTVASKYEELECLYAAVGKVIYEGLTNYEKATSNTNPTQLFGKTFSSPVLPSFFFSLIPFYPFVLFYSHIVAHKPCNFFFHTPTLFPTKVTNHSLWAIKPVSRSLKCKPMDPAAQANIWSV